MKNKIAVLFAAGFVFAAQVSFGAPAVTSVTGSVTEGQAIQISGLGFGTKVPAKPYLWADFESGLNPTSLGTKTAWDEVSNMTWSTEGPNASHCAKATYVNSKLKDGVSWTLRTDYNSWNGDGQKFYVFKHEKMNFTVTNQTAQNWKIWRMWPSAFGYPNVYSAAQNGRTYVEGVGSGFWSNPDAALATPTNSMNWTTMETIGQSSSGLDKTDGSILWRMNGKDVSGKDKNGKLYPLAFRSTALPTYMTMNYVAHGVAANTSSWSPAWSDDNRIWVDDVYVDITWSRVMLGDQSTFALCQKLEIQIPTAWSDQSVTISAHTGAFAGASQAYLYVFDKNGNVNAVGYPVTIGGGSPLKPQSFSGGTSGSSFNPKNVFNPSRGERVELVSLDESSSVDFTVYDPLGRKVKEFSGDEPAGSVTWDGRNDSGREVASGLYVVRLKSAGHPRLTEKVVVLK